MSVFRYGEIDPDCYCDRWRAFLAAMDEFLVSGRPHPSGDWGVVVRSPVFAAWCGWWWHELELPALGPGVPFSPPLCANGMSLWGAMRAAIPEGRQVELDTVPTRLRGLWVDAWCGVVAHVPAPLSRSATPVCRPLPGLGAWRAVRFCLVVQMLRCGLVVTDGGKVRLATVGEARDAACLLLAVSVLVGEEKVRSVRGGVAWRKIEAVGRRRRKTGATRGETDLDEYLLPGGLPGFRKYPRVRMSDSDYNIACKLATEFELKTRRRLNKWLSDTGLAGNWLAK